MSVGDELLAGAHPDLNGPEMARRLGELGVTVVSVAVVGDETHEIARAVRAALQRAPLVLVSGGLGPTLDDVTRHGIAEALGRKLVTDPTALAAVEAWYERRAAPMPASNRRQALLPEGATMVANRVGTAPGFRVEDGSARVVVSLPGPPAELRVVLGEEVLPWLTRSGRAGAELAERRFHLYGLSESVFAEEVGPWMDRDADPRMGCSVKKGVLTVVLRARGEGPVFLQRLTTRAEAFAQRFSPHIFSTHEPRPEFVLGEALLASGTRIAIAESCTAGLVAARLGNVPGISAVFERGYVTYSNAAKQELLGVAPELIERHGAVSAEVAAAMALGAARAAGTELSVAVTGVAGPGGGTPEKPVGLIWFGTALRGEVRTVERRLPPGERAWIRSLSAGGALHLALRRLVDAGLAELDGVPPIARAPRIDSAD